MNENSEDMNEDLMFEVGIKYTAWIPVKAKSRQDAIEKALNLDYHVPDNFEVVEYDKYDDDDPKQPRVIWYQIREEI